MGNLGMPELILIMVLALILFGPKKLPEIGKQVGKALGEFKRASNDLKRTIEDEMEKVNRVEPVAPHLDSPVAVSYTVSREPGVSGDVPAEAGAPLHEMPKPSSPEIKPS